MKVHDYAISTLTDYSRLDEIYRLTHDTLVEGGYLTPRADGQLANLSALDRSEQTTILVAQHADRIVGTFSISVDGPDASMADGIFETEAERIRRQNPDGLGSAWRIATSAEHRSERSLVTDLIRNAFLVAFERRMDTCLLVPVARHVPVYRRILGAKVVAQKTVSLDGIVQFDVALLMFDVARAWKIFTRAARA